MADIKQAAKWLDEGKTIARDGFLARVDGGGRIIHGEPGPGTPRVFCFFIDELLAEDWEIANG